MLLRRITKHVTDQNWFAIFLDFFIVVVGVFIGIQVANWNDASVKVVREQEVLVAVLEDLKIDLDNIESSSAMAKINIDTSNYLLKQANFETLDKISLPVSMSQLERKIDIPAADPISETHKNQLWKLVTLHYYPIQSKTAFSSLIAAGDLKIISNQSLISNLQDYTQNWRSLQESNVTTYKKFRDRAIFVGQEFGLSPFTSIPEQELISMVQNNPQLKAVISTLLEYTVIHKSQFSETKKLTKALIDKVEKEIN